jgi:prepilin-type N-terminal cleavage/methylation domain-containing protein
MLNERQTSRTTRTKRGFTLLELAISVAIISVLLVTGSFAFKSAQRNSSMARARNAVLSYAAVARSYAISNQIETMLVVNPYNGQFEIWHLNPPANGGPWDPYSSGTTPGTTDGYAFAPVLDGGARLPVDGNGEPLVYVNPIDYQERALVAGTQQEYDNLIWTAFCFDEMGTLVIRSRRIATRTGVKLDGTLTSFSFINRIRSNSDTSVNQSQSPDLRLLDSTLTPGTLAMVTVDDSLITSARGFVLSERRALESEIGRSFTASQLAGAGGWLQQTRYGQKYRHFSEEVLLDRYSAEAVIRGDE